MLLSAAISVFVVYLLSVNSPTLQMSVPAHWKIVKSAFRKSINDRAYQTYVQEYRNSIVLPPNYDWLDQRPNPVYPLVYAPIRYV